jgi:transcriptional regulator with XRE-family HTH domain
MRQAAERLGKSESYLSELVARTKTPSLQLAYDIECLTGGEIPMHYWLFPEPTVKKVDSEVRTKRSEKQLETNNE